MYSTEQSTIKGEGEAGSTVRRITLIGLIVNLLLSAVKFMAGILGSSQAVVADAVHSLSDSSTDIAVIVGSHFWSKPADQDHPYGHRRIETVVTIFIGVVLMVAGLGIAWEALVTLHQADGGPPGPIAAAAAALSILLKEILYRWTFNAGRRIRSQALVANAWHHRLDAVSSVPALLAVGGAVLFPGWTFLDHVGALVVSLLILYAAIRIIRPGLGELIDAGASREICEAIKSRAGSIGPVKDVHDVRTRYVSGGMLVDLHIVVDGGMTVRQGHRIAERVREMLLDSRYGVMDVVVHVDPHDDPPEGGRATRDAREERC